MTGIRAGLRVLDLSRMLSGPYATMMLADHGAEVIKVEDAQGDTSRANGPFRDDDPGHDWAGDFVSLNRSKKSIALDLKSEAGKATLHQMVAHADVLVENFRPEVMERLSLSCEALAAINSRLVHTANRGFGDPCTLASPNADWPDNDAVAQAIGVVDDAFCRILAKVMGQVALGLDPSYATRAARRANMATVDAIGTGWTATHSTTELTTLLGGRTPFGPVNDIKAIFADPHVDARGVIASVPHADPKKRPWRVAANPLRFANAPAAAPTAPSRLGADQALTKADPKPQIDPRALRNAFGAFATGVTVITTRQADGTPRGFTANSFTSVSLDPPLLLVCLAKSAHSADIFAHAPHFAVNILAEDQKALSGLFASRAPDKFQQCDWAHGHADVPVLAGTLAQFTCARHRLVDAGDHLVLIGRVEDFATREAQPLGYFRGTYFSVGLERDLARAAAAAKGNRIGVVLACGEGVLLREDAGTLSLPLSPGPNPSLDALRTSLTAQGLTPDIDFVYAAFDDRTTGGHAIYYHGCTSGPAPAGFRVLPLADLATAPMSNAAEAAMLARYSQDCRNGSFSIYLGNETIGSVRQVAAI